MTDIASLSLSNSNDGHSCSFVCTLARYPLSDLCSFVLAVQIVAEVPTYAAPQTRHCTLQSCGWQGVSDKEFKVNRLRLKAEPPHLENTSLALSNLRQSPVV
jgi:hypothetical protein